MNNAKELIEYALIEGIDAAIDQLDEDWKNLGKAMARFALVPGKAGGILNAIRGAIDPTSLPLTAASTAMGALVGGPLFGDRKKAKEAAKNEYEKANTEKSQIPTFRAIAKGMHSLLKTANEYSPAEQEALKSIVPVSVKNLGKNVKSHASKLRSILSRKSNQLNQ